MLQQIALHLSTRVLTTLNGLGGLKRESMELEERSDGGVWEELEERVEYRCITKHIVYEYEILKQQKRELSLCSFLLIFTFYCSFSHVANKSCSVFSDASYKLSCCNTLL